MRDRIVTRLRRWSKLLRLAARAYADDRAIRLGAGLAYYSLFALVPILSLTLSLATFFFGQTAVDSLATAISDLLGDQAASVLVGAIEETEGVTFLLSMTSLIVLIFAGGLLFAALRDIVDIIWGGAAEWSVAITVRNRIFAITAVLGSSLLLTVTLFAQGVLGLFADRLDIRIVDRLILFTGSIIPFLIGVVFAAILFKFTPNADVAWRHVWFPSLVSMLLLSLGSWGYGLYVSVAGLGSAAGVTGTIFLGLALVYYAAQIVLYGFEIVQVSYKTEPEIS
jgi:membrane protein